MARTIAFVGAYLALVVLGIQLGHWITAELRQDLHHSPETDALWHGMVLAAFAGYVVLMTLPFVPGVEIGLLLLTAFGGELALLVYLGTVLALSLAFLIGRTVPERTVLVALSGLRLRRAHALTSRLQRLPPERRMAALLERAPAGWPHQLLRHRLPAVAVLLNLPGNALLGGGGGIAMVAGMSRLCGFPSYLLTVCIATAPVPTLVALTDGAVLGGAAS